MRLGNIYHLIAYKKEPDSPLDYAMGTDLHRPIMSKLGEHRGRLYRERYSAHLI